MPYPKTGESEQAFVSRGMGDPEAVKSFPDPKQREAFLYSRYKEKKKMLNPSIDLNGELILKEAPKPYGDVKYADPSEGKYPIDTEEHIRAAWNYVNKPHNQTVLGSKASSVRAAIIRAWKDKIDPKGPPSA